MTDKLSFALVSPERELFNGDVDHVVVPKPRVSSACRQTTRR